MKLKIANFERAPLIFSKSLTAIYKDATNYKPGPPIDEYDAHVNMNRHILHMHNGKLPGQDKILVNA